MWLYQGSLLWHLGLEQNPIIQSFDKNSFYVVVINYLCVYPFPNPLVDYKLHEGWNYFVYHNIFSTWSSAWYMVDTQWINICCVTERPFSDLLSYRKFWGSFSNRTFKRAVLTMVKCSSRELASDADLLSDPPCPKRPTDPDSKQQPANSPIFPMIFSPVAHSPETWGGRFWLPMHWAQKNTASALP